MYPVFVNKFRFIRFQAMATVIMSVKGRYPYCLQRSKSRRRNTLSTWTFRHKKTHWYSFHFTYLLKHSCRYLRSHTVLSFTSKIRLTELCANFLHCLSYVFRLGVLTYRQTWTISYRTSIFCMGTLEVLGFKKCS